MAYKKKRVSKRIKAPRIYYTNRVTGRLFHVVNERGFGKLADIEIKSTSGSPVWIKKNKSSNFYLSDKKGNKLNG